jgi:hypothetical protein
MKKIYSRDASTPPRSATPIDFAPGGASILLKVDDGEDRWDVLLPKGISKNSNRVALELSG